MKKLKQSQYYGIALLLVLLVAFWAVFKILAPATFGSPDKLATYMKSAADLCGRRLRTVFYLRYGTV